AVRRQAAFSAGRFAGDSEEVVPALVQALKEPDIRSSPSELSVPQAAAWALGGAARFHAKPAIPALLAALEGENKDLRSSVPRALAGIARADPTAAPLVLPKFHEMLRDKEHPANRDLALDAVYQMGPPAQPLVPDLVELLKAARDVPERALA